MWLECKHVCDCATCLQLSGLTATEAAVAMVERLGASGEFGSLREVEIHGWVRLVYRVPA